MSKKIAQLTRVIFRLHTESLDRRDLVAHVKKRCDEEIAALVQHTNDVIQEVQKNSDDYRDNLEKIMRQEYEQRFEQEKKECELVKEKIENEGKQLVETYAIESARNKKEIENLKAQVEKAKRHFEEAADKLAQENRKIIESIEEKHKKELESCVNEGNARYNKLMIESFRKEEEQKKQTQRDLAEAKRLAASESHVEMENMKNKILELEKKIRLMEAAAKKTTITINNLKTNITNLEAENEALKKKNEENEKELLANKERELQMANDLNAKELDEKRKAFEEQLKQSELEKENLRHEIDRINAEFHSKEKEFLMKIATLEKTIAANDGISNQKLQKILAQHKAEVDALELKFTQFVSDAQRKESLMNEELLNIQKQYLEEIEELKRQHQSELSKKDAEIQKMKQQHIQEMQKNTSECERAIQAMRNEMETNRENEERLRAGVIAESASLKARMEKMIMEHELQQQEFQNKKQMDIQQIHQNYTVQIEALRKQYEDKLKELDESCRLKVKHAEDHANQRIKQMEENGEVNLRLSIEQQKSALEQEMMKQMELMRNEVDKRLEEHNAELKKKETEYQRLNDTFDRTLAEKNKKIGELQAKLTELQRAWDDEKLSIFSDHAEEIHCLRAEMEEMKQNYEKRIQELIQSHEAQISELNKKLEALKAQKDRELAHQSEKYEKEKEILRKEIEAVKAEVGKLQDASGSSLREMQSKLDALTKEHANQLEEMKKAHESQYEALTARHKEEQKKLNERLDSFIAQAKEYKLANQKLHDEIGQLTSTAEKDILSRISEFERQKLCDMNAQASQYQKKVSELEAKLEELKQKMGELEQRHQRELDERERTAGDRLSDLDRMNLEKMTEMQERHKSDLQNKDTEIEELRRQIEELELRWGSRDARPEDLERIQKLEDTVKERTDTLTKLFNELKHYQNELVNRETAYNKLFNTRPNIGVYNVIERKIKRDTLVSETIPTAMYLPPLADAKMAKTLTPRASSVAQKKPSVKPERPSTAIKRPVQVE